MQPMFSLLEHCNPDHLRTHNFNDIQYYSDGIHYCDMLLYYCDSGKI